MKVKTVEKTGSTDSVVIDTYAWVEYFRGSSEGKNVSLHLDDKYDIITSAMTVAELGGKYSREGIEDLWENEARILIEVKSRIIPVDSIIANIAGKIKTAKRKEFNDFGMADAIIAATAKVFNAKLLTGDKHLKNDDNAIDITK